MIKVESNLDLLLGGGLLPKNITHLYGVPASGKTNIALMATAAAAKTGKVAYIDCEGGFSFERLAQISGERFESMLKNILLVEPTDFDEQKIAFNKLDEIVGAREVKLVVVDSISALYRLEKEKSIKEFGGLLAKLVKVARKYDIPILMTNQVYSDPDSGRIVPVGGDVTRYWSKIIIELEKEENTGLRVARLIKHKFRPEGLYFKFRIVEHGIEAEPEAVMEEEIENRTG